METTDSSEQSRPRPADDDDGVAAGKLIPEWGIAADDQIVVIGLAALLAVGLLFGWTLWQGGDDEVATVVTTIDDAGSDTTIEAAAAVTTAVPVTEAPTTTEAAQQSSTTVAAAPATPVIGDVQAAVDPFPGAITGTADDTVAVLNGFVANQAESDEAEEAAGAVEGITSVENNLELLEPAVSTALQDSGVVGATAVGIGTEITVSGTIDSEDDRAPAIEAAEAVEGVTSVIDDRLNVSVTADLNELPQVQFETGSDVIKPESFDDLDQAAALITEAGDVKIEIRGYTDTRGNDADNLALSKGRAEGVLAYLVAAGVEADVLTANGFGETEEFGPDFESNRVVLFQQIDG